MHHLVWEIASNVEHGSSLSACNRREVLRWGLVLAGSVLLDPRFAFAQGMVDDPAQAARGDSTHATPAISLAPERSFSLTSIGDSSMAPAAIRPRSRFCGFRTTLA